MTELVWDKVEDRSYETGIDRVAFYSPTTGAGVVWNGVQSLSEESTGGDISDYHLEGVKFFSATANVDYNATIRAFSAPREFLGYEGYSALAPGVLLTRQPTKKFGLTYRTLVGPNDYKIHLVYNVLASPGAITNTTEAESVTPMVKEWRLSATPIALPMAKPTAHIIFESAAMDPALLAEIEDTLYGTSFANAHWPTLYELLAILEG